ncbi:MAG TPA: hypothetical protein VG123_11165 [Streptosporangiaceae bacterium]|nr:hypothetical protein [Streptosporangiaceae bacterium]
MIWPSRIATAAGRGALGLVPAGRRDWAEAVWAEAHEVPAGWPRLAWRASGVLLIAKEGQMARTIGSWLLFAVAAGAAAWGAWPGPPVSHAAAVQGGILITLALLVGLPLLSRSVLGSPDNRAARWLRAGFYAAILAVLPAQTAIRLFLGTVPRSGNDRHTFDVIQGPGVPGSVSGGPGWAGEIGILVFTACFLAVLLALTARRTRVAPATLAIGAGAGLMLGLVMYAITPLGLNVKFPDRPWLHGSAADTVGALAWILLFGAPLVAGALAGRRCSVEDDPAQAAVTQAWQGFAAGVVSGGVGAMLVTVLGAGTTALMVRSASVRDLLYHGPHLTASAIYGRELYASQDVSAYLLLFFGFPIIGLIMGLVGAGVANLSPRLPDGGRPGGPPGPGGPGPLPAAPDGSRHVDAEELTVLAGGADAGPTAPTPVLAHH